MTDTTMTTILATNGLITLAYAAVGIIIGWGVLRALDRLGGIDFKATAERISNEAKPAAIYFGLRFVGVCTLIGMAIS